MAEIPPPMHAHAEKKPTGVTRRFPQVMNGGRLASLSRVPEGLVGGVDTRLSGTAKCATPLGPRSSSGSGRQGGSPREAGEALGHLSVCGQRDWPACTRACPHCDPARTRGSGLSGLPALLGKGVSLRFTLGTGPTQGRSRGLVKSPDGVCCGHRSGCPGQSRHPPRWVRALSPVLLSDCCAGRPAGRAGRRVGTGHRAGLGRSSGPLPPAGRRR